MLDIRNYAVIGLGVVVVALLATVDAGRVQLAGERAAHAQTRQKNADVLRDLAERTARAAGAAMVVQQTLNRAASTLDTNITKEKTNALADNDRRRTADRDGPQRLRIAASCPATTPSSPGVPSAPAAPSVDPGTVEIAPAVRQDLWDFRSELIGDTAKLEYLQQRQEAQQAVQPD